MMWPLAWFSFCLESTCSQISRNRGKGNERVAATALWGVGGGGRNRVRGGEKSIGGALEDWRLAKTAGGHVRSVARPVVSVRADESTDNNGLLGRELQPGVLAAAAPRVGLRRAQALGEFAWKPETPIHVDLYGRAKVGPRSWHWGGARAYFGTVDR